MQENQESITQGNIETETQDLQPMNLSDILDGMFTLYRKHLSLYLNIVVVYFIFSYITEKLLLFSLLNTVTDGNIAALFLFTIASVLLSFYIVGVLSYATAHVFLGQNISAGNAFLHTLRLFAKLLGCSIVYSLVCFGLFITIIGIPFAIYLFIRWGFYTLPVLLEEKTVMGSIKRSSELVKGSWLRVFCIVLLIFLIWQMIQHIFSTSIGVVFSLIPVAHEMQDVSMIENFRRFIAPTPVDIGWPIYLIRSFITMGIHSILLPIASIGSTLLYFDLRIRKDAYDLEMRTTN
ncbi:hypothetical protein C6497_04885 [Candidatus Poribacteria bacterium]|nr:MAG: hypothetical protein C6497_04885 [Candidatus Poribacteria bacterium]